MSSKIRLIGIVLLIATQIALVTIWAINGYDDTWLYASAMVISLSSLWALFSKDNK